VFFGSAQTSLTRRNAWVRIVWRLSNLILIDIVSLTDFLPVNERMNSTCAKLTFGFFSLFIKDATEGIYWQLICVVVSQC
jgi:phage-related holin